MQTKFEFDVFAFCIVFYPPVIHRTFLNSTPDSLGLI